MFFALFDYIRRNIFLYLTDFVITYSHIQTP